MNKASYQKNLNKQLFKLTEKFETEDFFKSRKERNWEKFDKLDEIEKLKYRIREIKEYLYGYFDDNEEGND